jgi:hypothetical protein
VLLTISGPFSQGGQWGCPFARWRFFVSSYREINRPIDVSDPSESLVRFAFGDNPDETERDWR